MFRGKLSEQDVVDTQQYSSLLIIRKGVRWFSASVLIVPAVFLACVFAMKPTTELLIGFVVWILWMYLVLVYYPQSRRRNARRHYRTHANEYHETTVTLSRDRVRIENPSIDAGNEWKYVRVIAETPDGILFSTHGLEVQFWIPNRLLNDESRKIVLNWAAANNVQIRKL